ncbi:MAG: hypothetical protein GX100_00735, partial [candidate division WS1 bacterium]|nr:hypothetical protein [candidate division WS1 bacterium]
PTGKSLEAHRDFVMSRTRSLGLRWPVAFNAEPGRYTVRVTELVSGTTGELKVSVK